MLIVLTLKSISLLRQGMDTNIDIKYLQPIVSVKEIETLYNK